MWVQLELENAVASESWGYEDQKWCWYWKLLIQQARGEGTGVPGYLPNDNDRLWRIAGARRRWFFEEKGGRELLQRHFRSTEDGRWIYNPKMLEIVTKALAKQQKAKGDEKLDSPLSLCRDFDVGFGVVLTDIEELKAIGDEVFAYYMRKFGRDKRYKFTPIRRKKFELRMCELLPDVGDALAAGQEARRAIDNLHRSEWHVSNGHFDWVDQIFKSREEFEKRLVMVSNGKQQTYADKNERSVIDAVNASIAGDTGLDQEGNRHDGDHVRAANDRKTIDAVRRGAPRIQGVSTANGIQPPKT
jgi:hypothetical protein